MIKYVIFDMDGTLLDTERFYQESWLKTAEKWHLEGMGIEEYTTRIAGRSIVNGEKALKELYGRDFDSAGFMKERYVLFNELIEQTIPIKKGSIEILTFLRKAGIKTALATSTPRDLALKCLKRAGLYDLLDEIITGDMVENGKPAPDIFLKAGEAIEAVLSETAVIEDAESGLTAAHRANMKPIMVVDIQKPKAELAKICYAIFDNLLQVIDLIKKENEI